LDSCEAKPILQFIGRIETPYQTIRDCPRNIDPSGPLCTLRLDPARVAGLTGLAAGQSILVLYWFEGVERSALVQTQPASGKERGVFALRSPHRPNPIGAAVVRIESIAQGCVSVRGLDCLNGTPLLDIKPAIFAEETASAGKGR